MTAFRALLRRELWSFAISPFSWVLIGFWMLLNGLFFSILLRSADVQSNLGMLPTYLFGSGGLLAFLLLPVIPPLLTLRLFAEEHRLGTLEPLLTAPISDAAVVLAKYVAACLFFLVFWLGVLALFVLLQFYDAPLDWPRILSAFSGALLASALFLAVGLWTSSWGGNLILAAAGGAGVNYMLLFLPAMFSGGTGRTAAVARAMNIPQMLEVGFAAGLIDSYAVLYFPLLALLFLYLTWMRLVSRRWVP